MDPIRATLTSPTLTETNVCALRVTCSGPDPKVTTFEVGNGEVIRPRGGILRKEVSVVIRGPER